MGNSRIKQLCWEHTGDKAWANGCNYTYGCKWPTDDGGSFVLSVTNKWLHAAPCNQSFPSLDAAKKAAEKHFEENVMQYLEE